VSELSFVVALGALGLFVGSFLNVCIYRLPLGRTVLWGRSHCPRCDRQIRAWENIPVVSWLALGGRCAGCRAPIGVQYPLVELVTGGLFAGAAWLYGPTLLLVPRLIFACAMVVLFMIDLQHRILPNVITLPGIVAGFAFSLFVAPGWLSSLIGIVVGGGSLLAIAEGYYRWRGEEGLGMGDVKMLAMIGAFLGWQLTLVTLVLSSFAGSIVGVAMIAASRGSLKYALPFGTFLSMGAFLAAAFGERLLAWYLTFY
jgi:leader peptidase (prepilin peptidase)/N-methyltransferase